MTEQLASDPHAILSSRVFGASRERMFQAFADPNQLAQWWGPKGFSNTIDEFDLRPGGAWRSVMHAPDGSTFQNENHFVQVVPNERVVFKHVQATHDFTMTMTFEQLELSTRLTWHMRFESAEEAERVRPYIVEGNEQNFDRLAAHLASLQGR